MRACNQASRNPETQPSRKRCVLVHCLALRDGEKVNLSPQVCESDRFENFCGCSGKTLTVCLQYTR